MNLFFESCRSHVVAAHITKFLSSEQTKATIPTNPVFHIHANLHFILMQSEHAIHYHYPPYPPDHHPCRYHHQHHHCHQHHHNIIALIVCVIETSATSLPWQSTWPTFAPMLSAMRPLRCSVFIYKTLSANDSVIHVCTPCIVGDLKSRHQPNV